MAACLECLEDPGRITVPLDQLRCHREVTKILKMQLVS